MPDRVVVFIDAQNTYRRARAAFFDDRNDSHVAGQINPKALAEFLTLQGPRDMHRVLSQVRLYTGRPDATRDPKSYSAHMKQCSVWEKSGVVVIPRTLRYPATWPRDKAQEKGIDVKLAIDFVTMAVIDEYDVGIMVSVDTDLTPALEYVAVTDKAVEVAAWRSPRLRGRLSVKSKNIWCHWLDMSVYNRVNDPTNYAK